MPTVAVQGQNQNQEELGTQYRRPRGTEAQLLEPSRLLQRVCTNRTLKSGAQLGLEHSDMTWATDATTGILTARCSPNTSCSPQACSSFVH